MAKKPVKPQAKKAVTNAKGPELPSELKNEADRMFQNGLADALGVTDGMPGLLCSPQISQVNTLFKNNRWYLISNMRQLLSEIYVEHGPVQNVVDVPVDDAFRGGVELSSKQIDEEQIQKLQAVMDRQGDLNVVAQSMKWNRLYGGAGVLIMTDQKPDTPFDMNLLRPDSPLEFRPVDMWELFFDIQNVDGYNTELQTSTMEFYNYYGKKVQKSRVMKMQGLVAPSFIRPRLRGWGFSILEAMVRSINQYLKATDLSFEVLDEFKLDVFRLKNLTNTLFQPAGEAKVRQRVQVANSQKNYQNAIVLDSEDEYDHKQLSFAGLAEAMDGIRAQLASDLRIPQTKLFGQSAAGFNSGEDDIEVYNAMVESQVRNKCKYEILRIAEIRCQQLFGMVPTDLAMKFKPLRVLSAEGEENVKTQKFNRLLAAKTSGEITTVEFREACNRDNLLSIQLDTANIDLLSGDDEDEATDIGEDKEEKKENSLFSKTSNSTEYDKKAFEADGGEGMYPAGRGPLFMDDFRFDDKAKYAQAKQASQACYGKYVWQFVVWKYKQLGGTLR